MAAVVAIILGSILGSPASAAASPLPDIGPTSTLDGCAPIIASISPSGAIVRDGSSLRFNANVLCGGVTDITNDPTTKIKWSVAGGIGTMSQQTGNSSNFNSNTKGSGQVVISVQYSVLAAEARADVEVVDNGGSCQVISASVIPSGALVQSGSWKQFRSSVRCDQNDVTSSSQLSWTVSGGIGSVNPNTGYITNFTGGAPGSGRVNSGVHYGNQNLGGYAVVLVSGSGSGGGPYVTGTVPADGAVDVLRNESVEISFSAAMNASATQGAISANPAVTGSFSWPDSTRVVWTPSPILAVSTKYAVTVGTAAKSQTGQNLVREHVFNFTTGTGGSMAPAILSTTPVNGAVGVPVNSTIVFEWSVDMQKATAEGATSAMPAMTGTWLWENGDTRATLTPSAALAPSTQYTVNVSTAATSQDGVKMVSPFSFKFTTAGPPPPPAPAVVSTSPADNQTGVPVLSPVKVEFSLPMEVPATEGAVSASPAILGAFAWDTNDSRLVLTPSSPLQAGTLYTITITTAAKSKAGAALPADHVFKFSTAESPPEAPKVVSNSPTDGQVDVPVTSDLVITFSIAMDRASVANALSVSPAAPGSLVWSAGDTVVTVNPSADLQANTRYTVRVGTAAKSAQGVALPSEHSFAFTTASGVTPVPPKVLATNPTDGAAGVVVSQLVSVTFDQPMDKVSTEASWSISPAAPGSFLWDPDSQVLSYDTEPDLQHATAYTVSIATIAKSAKGVPLPAAFSFKFTTAAKDDKPPVVTHTPPGEVEEGTPIEIVATVTDDSGVASVTLLYHSPGQVGFTSATMAPGSGSQFVFTIPSDAVKPEKVVYYIQAADTVGNGVNSPANAPDSVHAVAVRPKSGGPGPGPGGGAGGSVMIGGVSVPVLFLLLVLVVVGVLATLFFMRRRKRPSVEAPPASFFDSGARVSVAQPEERLVMPEAGSPSGNAAAGIHEVRPSPKSEPSLLGTGLAAASSPGAASDSTSGASTPRPAAAPGPVEKDETPEATAKEREELKERIRAKRAARSAGSGNGNGETLH